MSEPQALVYLYLFHGRTDPAKQMDDWGTEGPFLGPFYFVQTTYGSHIQLGTDDDDMQDLCVGPDDLIYYDGVYYSDWSVTTNIQPAKAQKFEKAKAERPATEAPVSPDFYRITVGQVQTLAATHMGRSLTSAELALVQQWYTAYQAVPPCGVDSVVEEILEALFDRDGTPKQNPIPMTEIQPVHVLTEGHFQRRALELFGWRLEPEDLETVIGNYCSDEGEMDGGWAERADFRLLDDLDPIKYPHLDHVFDEKEDPEEVE